MRWWEGGPRPLSCKEGEGNLPLQNRENKQGGEASMVVRNESVWSVMLMELECGTSGPPGTTLIWP